MRPEQEMAGWVVVLCVVGMAVMAWVSAVRWALE